MKISVIIPAYNAAKEIKETISSIEAGNTKTAYEIIVVDDGSHDETPAICQALATEDAHLRFLSQPNQGPAAARENGIRAATGDYLLFCDSDDRFLPGALDCIATLAEGQDLLIFGYNLVRDGVPTPYRVPDGTLQTREAWRARLGELYGANMLNQVWGKAFRKEILTGIHFPDVFWGEDRLFLFEVLEKAETIRITSECFYDYIQRPDSLISRFLDDKPEICQRIACRMRDLALAKDALTEETLVVFSYMYQKSLLSCLANLFAPSCALSYREKRAYTKKVLRMDNPFSGAPAMPDGGTAYRLSALVLKTKSVSLNLLLARGITFVSRVAPTLFFRAKHALNSQQKGE